MSRMQKPKTKIELSIIMRDRLILLGLGGLFIMMGLASQTKNPLELVFATIGGYMFGIGFVLVGIDAIIKHLKKPKQSKKWSDFGC